MALPAFVVYASLYLYPALSNLLYATQKWDGITKPEFTGLHNMTYLLTQDDLFRKALGNNLRFMLVVVIFQTAFALLFATFLLKNSNGLANLRQAISAVQSGLVMVDPNLKTMFTRAGQNLSLTDQERTVMERVAEGKSNAVISGEIFASEKTVERVLSSIYSKYGLVGTSKVENPRVRATLIFRGLSK